MLSDADELLEWHTATVTGSGKNPAILVKRFACYKVQDLSLTGSLFHLFKNHQWFWACEICHSCVEKVNEALETFLYNQTITGCTFLILGLDFLFGKKQKKNEYDISFQRKAFYYEYARANRKSQTHT